MCNIIAAMASRAVPAFDTENANAVNSHARLLMAAVVLNDAELAVKFGVTVATVRTWKKRPLGYKPGKAGRPKKAKGDSCS